MGDHRTPMTGDTRKVHSNLQALLSRPCRVQAKTNKKQTNKQKMGMGEVSLAVLPEEEEKSLL